MHLHTQIVFLPQQNLEQQQQQQQELLLCRKLMYSTSYRLLHIYKVAHNKYILQPLLVFCWKNLTGKPLLLTHDVHVHVGLIYQPNKMKQQEQELNLLCASSTLLYLKIALG